MEKLNGNLETFLGEIERASGCQDGIISCLNDSNHKDLSQAAIYLKELEEGGYIYLPTNDLTKIQAFDTKVLFLLPETYVFTSKGETYFSELEKQKKADRRQRWANRGWQVLFMLLSAFFGGVIGSVWK